MCIRVQKTSLTVNGFAVRLSRGHGEKGGGREDVWSWAAAESRVLKEDALWFPCGGARPSSGGSLLQWLLQPLLIRRLDFSKGREGDCGLIVSKLHLHLLTPPGGVQEPSLLTGTNANEQIHGGREGEKTAPN